MIETVEFHIFKALRKATLPLGRFTLIVGPNGSGKTTAIQALQAAAAPGSTGFEKVATAGLEQSNVATVVEVVLHWGTPHTGTRTNVRWFSRGGHDRNHLHTGGDPVSDADARVLKQTLLRIRAYSFEAQAISAVVSLKPGIEMGPNGTNTVVVLDRLRDKHPERFEALNEELGRWLPEFDRMLFDVPSEGARGFSLRTRDGKHSIPAADLSQGTLLSLAMLTLAYLPEPPPLVCLEEPDRGIHPRLLREVRDALYRLSYPEDVGEKRDPVQVLATTHSPYFLDLFRDRREEIVIAHKVGHDVRFERLCERPDVDEILQDSRLGDAWYTGVLGGVPVEQ